MKPFDLHLLEVDFDGSTSNGVNLHHWTSTLWRQNSTNRPPMVSIDTLRSQWNLAVLGYKDSTVVERCQFTPVNRGQIQPFDHSTFILHQGCHFRVALYLYLMSVSVSQLCKGCGAPDNKIVRKPLISRVNFHFLP